ncbi:MAG TPA: class I SAM-dependent methyltransferase [Terracidiphilus sp.]|jgi:SAM-dependent methyltransferase|nr:class I SAM-dependent methyltransferase [Terracidiphilus sp.]
MTSQPNQHAETADFEFAALSEARNYRAALLQDFGLHLRGNVLEVGAGIGQITAALLETPAIQNLTSIEPDAAFCSRLRSIFPEHRIVEGTIADLKSDVSWNAILSVNVLEHIEDDDGELAEYNRLLRPTHGALCLFVPSRQEIYAPIDRDFGHFRRYSKAALKHKLALAGFKKIRIHYYNFPGYFLWWLNFCLLRKRAFDIASVRLFDKVLFPAIHGFETHVLRPPIGQSLIVIATT